MTVVVHKPFTPIQQMHEALRIWEFAAQILEAVKTGSLVPYSLPTLFKLRMEFVELPFEVRFTRREYGRVSRHNFYASTGLCALVFDEAMNVTFGRKTKEFPTEHTGLTAARAIVFQVRNAFAHGPSQPKWAIRNANYKRKYRIDELMIEADLATLDGQDFSMRHIGGWIRYKALLTYCLERVEDKQRGMDRGT
ncbi:MAG TPA: hypothetical protein VJL08_02695 [Dehalococcoidia bacterium]|nr:hypothetical protein [Dehalococcoidia bacterium]